MYGKKLLICHFRIFSQNILTPTKTKFTLNMRGFFPTEQRSGIRRKST